MKRSASLCGWIFLTMSGWVALGQTKPPAPILVNSPMPGETSLTVRFSDPGPGELLVLHVWRQPKGGTAAVDDKVTVGPRTASGDVGIELEKALVGGEILSFDQVVAGVTSLRSSAFAVPEIPAPTITRFRASAFAGYTGILTEFDVSNGEAGKLEATFGTGGESSTFSLRLTADDLKKGKAEIPLGKPLVCETGGVFDCTKKVQVSLRVTRKGAEAKTRNDEITVQGLTFEVNQVPLEGSQEISGKAPSFVKSMSVHIYGGAWSSRAVDSLQTPSPSTSKNKSVTIGAGNEPNPQGLNSEEPLVKRLPKLYSQKSGLTFGNLPINEASKIAKDPTPTLEETDFAANYFRDELSKDIAAVDKGSFTFTLKNRLDAGQRIVLCGRFDDEPGPVREVCAAQNLTVRSVIIDYGRLRAFFSAGTVISAADNSFGKASPYVAFNGDLAFVNGLIRPRADFGSATRTSDPNQQNDLYRLGRFGISWHGIVDIRLTQAAVASGSKTDVDAGPTAKQAGFFQTGFYLPMRTAGMDWVYNGVQYTSYVGPVMKFGITYLNDGVVLDSKTVQSTTTTTDLKNPTQAPKVVTADPTTSATTVKSNLPFYGYGVRFGVMRYDLMGKTLRNRQIAPDNIAYLDVTYGQNGIYRKAGIPVTTTGDPIVTEENQIRTSTVTKTTRVSNSLDPGFSLEARMKLPYLPAQVGADVFFHSSGAARSINPDFRFVLGFRMDVSKAFGRIFGVTP